MPLSMSLRVCVCACALILSVLSQYCRAIRIICSCAQGHTRGGRPEVAAFKPAPIVVNYLVCVLVRVRSITRTPLARKPSGHCMHKVRGPRL